MLRKIVIVSCLLISALGYSQTLSVKKDANKDVKKHRIFTSEERDNIQLWYHDQVEEMKMSDAVREKYESIVEYYVVKIYYLSDKENGYLDDDELMKVKFDEYVARLNGELKPILSKENYQQHKNAFGRVVRSVYNRKGWKIEK